MIPHKIDEFLEARRVVFQNPGGLPADSRVLRRSIRPMYCPTSKFACGIRTLEVRRRRSKV